MGYNDYAPDQLTGSEYGGINNTFSSIQPKPPEALDNADKLRLGYLTGVEDDSRSIEDRRQFCGLRPADGRRPRWLSHVDNIGTLSDGELVQEAQE